ncbi:DUF1015 family protein [Streptomyces phyllanthi]|uniref:DUF1015 domain-containing protein n=1 Tax=Streptomyces phyllanthi TaxID=1803180 RepID=A0A5N8VZS8_9ACTN|nr:DUF1015 domain-containing protein [Streptomyces phyllanthi]MPY39445.1 DUF1015 domain-containing protein [Streptomyces phyllanthi]
MPTPAVPGQQPTPLRLRSFRAVRYDEDRVGDLSRLLAPPHDELSLEQVRALRAHPHHIARLIHTHEPRATARHLRRWLNRGVLRRDERPAVYVYQQQRGARILQRGLIGDLVLPPQGGNAEGVLLPHEGVSPHVVRQRAAHMSGLRAQLEPLLLTYRGTESTAAQVMEHVTRRTPTAVARLGDITHTLWACHDEEEASLVTSGLPRGGALIADGHHRYAALRHLGAKPGGFWGSSLALLVDTVTYPLRLSAIHRVIPGLDPEKAASVAAEVARVRPLPEGPRPPCPGELVLAGAGQAWTVTDPQPEALREALATHPPEWATLPAAVSDHLLLADAWSVTDLPGAVRYVHNAGRAVEDVATPGNGVALLLPPITEDQVRELAGAGVLLPRKSTSFGPKPAAGLALRVLDPQ